MREFRYRVEMDGARFVLSIYAKTEAAAQIIAGQLGMRAKLMLEGPL